MKIIGLILLIWISMPAVANEPDATTIETASIITEAIDQAETAQIHGKAGHTSTLLEYAQESLTHAQAAEKKLINKSPHLDESIKHLNAAIENAKRDQPETATRHMEKAIEHMRLSIRK